MSALAMPGRSGSVPDIVLLVLGGFFVLLLVVAVVRLWRQCQSAATDDAARLWWHIHREAGRKCAANPGYRRSPAEQVALGVAMCREVFEDTGLMQAVIAGDRARLLHIGAVASVIGLPMVSDLMNRALSLLERRQAGRPVGPSVRLLEAEFRQMGGLARFSSAANAHIRKELCPGSPHRGGTLTQS